MSVKQPVGQKRLTNIAVVRVKKGGKRFEVACYKNKVISWRSGVEKDIDEVLQTHTIFSNVGKGTLAKSKDLKEAFGTDDEEIVCREILDRGEFQVSDKEREMQVSSQFRDIASIVMEKTINPETQRPYTMGMIERFIRDVHFSIDPHKSSKQQAIELIRDLEERFPIARARMELRLTVPLMEEGHLNSKISAWKGVIQSSGESDTHYWVVCQLDPGKYRESDAFMNEIKGRLEVVSMAVQKEGDASFDLFDKEEERRGEGGEAAEGREGGLGGQEAGGGSQSNGFKSLSEGFRSSLRVAETESGRSACASSIIDADRIVGSVWPNVHPQENLGSSASMSGSNTTGAFLLPGGMGSDNSHNIMSSAHSIMTGSSGVHGAGSANGGGARASGKEQRCSTCQAGFRESKGYREHFKSEWHKHNLKRKLQGLPPLSAEDCEIDRDIVEAPNDMHHYS